MSLNLKCIAKISFSVFLFKISIYMYLRWKCKKSLDKCIKRNYKLIEFVLKTRTNNLSMVNENFSFNENKYLSVGSEIQILKPPN